MSLGEVDEKGIHLTCEVTLDSGVHMYIKNLEGIELVEQLGLSLKESFSKNALTQVFAVYFLNGIL